MFFLIKVFLSYTTLGFTGYENQTESQSHIEQVVHYLTTDELEGRKTGTAGNREAALFLTNILEAYDISPLYPEFKDSLITVKGAWNVVGVIPGSDANLRNEYVVLGAHYDHIGILNVAEGDSIANGANDNASGVAVLTEVARNLAGASHKRSILIAFFTGEEQGMLGSHQLAKRLKKEHKDVVLMLNFEMLGVAMNREYEVYLTGFGMSHVGTLINRLHGDQLVGRLEKGERLRLFERSDNYPFYLYYDIPSHSLSSFDFENYPYYHHVKDEFDQLDLEFMTDFSRKITPVINNIIDLPKEEFN